MDQNKQSRPLPLQEVKINDEFWHREQELVRKEVISYQWNALNDKVEGASPSYCMHNFRAAGKLVMQERQKGKEYVPPKYTFRGFEALPEDPKHPEPDKFYGFVFQDSDFSKWIEAVAYSLVQHPDTELEREADEAIDLVCAAQLENGYLDTYYIINGMDRAFTHVKDHHELYCFGHLTEGAVAYYEATGKDKLLKAAIRFADYVYEQFGPEEGKLHGYPGHEIAEMALVRLYEVTGEEKYLQLSRYFVTERGKQPYFFDIEAKKRAKLDGEAYRQDKNPMRYAYYQAHEPVKMQKEAVGHAVRATYLYSGMADVARLTKDEELYQACVRLWDNITGEKLYITGGIGGTHMGESFSFGYDLPNDTAYSETCAAIGLVFFARRMLEISPDRKYADVMELALYNTVLSGMAMDGKSFFYVNPLEVVPEACKKDERKFHVKPVRQKWFGCACCPPNIARTVTSLGSYLYTKNQDTLFVHMYAGSEVETECEGGCLKISMESQMPWEGRAKLTIKSEKPVETTLAFRLPGWCKDPDIRYSEEKKSKTENGYLYLTGVFQPEEVITFDFPMKVRMLAANDRVREDIGKAAFMRGPVTYCAEEADNGKNLHLLKVAAEQIAKNPDVIKIDDLMIADQQVKTLKVPGFTVKRQEEELYVEYRMPKIQETMITLVPYYTWNNRGEGEMSVWMRT